MATITSTGIGSGLDVNSIITQLMAVESQPLTLLQSQKTKLTTQLSAVGKLQSYTSSMRDAASKLASVQLWNQTKATSGDTSAVTVTTDNTAFKGDYAVQVQSLAAGQTVTSRAWTASTDRLGAGTLTIELGSWGDSGFSAKSGSTPLTLTLGDSDSSLESIRDKINSAAAGVTASIVTDSSGARLSIRSAETGAVNAFRITATETTDDGNAAAGLSALAYDAAGGASQMTRYQQSGDAKATINGIPVTSASNTLSGVIEGVTLTLQKQTTSAVGVSVTPDDEAVTAAVNAFTKAFNDLSSYIRSNSLYDPATKTGGPLQGDRTALSIQSQLRGVINQESTASSTYGRLSQVGITMAKDGTLTLDSTKLAAGLANRAELKKLFATDGTTTSNSGFMDRFRDLGAALLDSGGSLQSRTDGLNSSIESNQHSQDRMNDRLAQTEARLRKQYQALDANMSKLSGLSNYISQQLTVLNASA